MRPETADGHQENYVYYTSGRSRALSGNTLFHAVNSVWADNSGHAIEGTSHGMGLFEGCVFENVPVVVASGFVGQMFSSEAAYIGQCQTYLGRSCITNIYSNSGAFNYDQYGFFVDFSGRTIAPALSASSIETSVPAGAGNTLPT
jgi:pectin lyase